MNPIDFFRDLPLAVRIIAAICGVLMGLALLVDRDLLNHLTHILQAIPLIICIPINRTSKHVPYPTASTDSPQ